MAQHDAVKTGRERLSAILSLPPPERYPALALALKAYVDDVPTARRLLSDLAWRARDLGHDLVPPPSDLPTETRVLVRCYYGQRLRFDFKFRELDYWCRQWTREDQDALLLALAGFAAFGLNDPQAATYVNRSLTCADADVKSRHACLHALWFAESAGDLDMLLTLTEQMLADGEGDANVYYRRAGGLRRTGRYAEARDAIDDAIEMLGQGQNDVHQDYVRERELIVAVGRSNAAADAAVSRIEELERRVTDTIAATSEDLGKRVDRAEGLVADSLLRTIEILGLFLALTGFVVGTAAAAVGSDSYWKLIIAMTLLLAGSLAFLVMMRWVVSSQRT